MKTLGRLLTRWQQRSDSDFYASMEIDTHRWSNRSGLPRRLSGQSDRSPQERESEESDLQLVPLLPRQEG
jgi:hypothetical protein